MKDSSSELSSEYLPRLSSDGQQSLEQEEEENEGDDSEEYEYVMMPQMIKSVITTEIITAFLNDSFISPSEKVRTTADAVDEGGSSREGYYSPLVLVCGPPRMVVRVLSFALFCYLLLCLKELQNEAVVVFRILF